MHYLHHFFHWLNAQLALPITTLFFATAILLTLKTGFIQLRGLGRFIRLLTRGVKEDKNAADTDAINPFHALFTAMSTSMGMGNIVGPSLAIVVGGPGALFWLVVYGFFASVTKFVEVTYALHFRQQTDGGHILGGPMQYLKFAHPFFANWYSIGTVILFPGWCSLQANTLGELLSVVRLPDSIINLCGVTSVPTWVTGICLATLLFIVLNGGAERVGSFSSKVVPVMFVMYVSCGLFIVLRDPTALLTAMRLIFDCAFSIVPAIGGFCGATVMAAMREGAYKGAYITEAGMGTSAIPHSMADTKRPTDQGILALYSVFSDTFLSVLSGLIVLVTAVWMNGAFSTTLMYQAFQLVFPTIGKSSLVFTMMLFVISTIIGNGFNGSRSYGAFTHYRYMQMYNIFISVLVFFGAILDVPLAWAIMEVVMPLIAIPNLIGIIILSFKYPQVLKS